MAEIYSLNAFDSEAFEKEPIKSVNTISKHLVSGVIEKYTEGMSSGIVADNGIASGFVDIILTEIYEPTENSKSNSVRLSLLKLFSFLSESEGRFAQEFGLYDPMFYGYLKVDELKELHSLLLNLPSEMDKEFLNEFKDQLIQICEECTKKNLGILYSALP